MTERQAPYEYEHDVRPLYRKKRVIIPAAIVALLLVMGIIGAATGDAQPTAAQSSDAGEAPAAAPSSSAERTTEAPAPSSSAERTTEAPAPSSPVEPTTEAPTPAPTTEETPPPPAPTTSAAPAAPEVNFPMPDLVGINLQDAQNAMQRLGVYFTTSTDASGLGRAQLIDSNWVVCGQNVPPGTQMTGDLEGKIELTAAKIGESC